MLYDPSNPHSATVDSAIELWAFSIFSGLCGGAVGGFGALLILAGWRNGRARARALQGARRLPAVVIGSEPCGKSFHPIVEVQSPRYGALVKGIGDGYVAPIENGVAATVHIDPLSPHGYWVEIAKPY